MRILWILLVAGSLALGGCVDEQDSSSAPRAPDSGWSIDEHDDQTTTSLQCDQTLEPSWFEPYESPWYRPNHFGFSPNGGLLRRTDAMMGTAQVHRTSDGEAFFDISGSNLHAIDHTWTLEVRSQMYTYNVDIRRRGEAEPMGRNLGGNPLITAAFGPRAETVGLLTCRDNVTSVVVWSVADNREVLREELDPQLSCRSWTRATPKFSYTPDGDALVVLARESGHLIHVDLQGGQTHSTVAHQPQESDIQMLPTQGGLDLAVHPSGRFVATSGAEGQVRFWELPSLEPTGTSFDSGVAAVNLQTYATPHRVSPLAWSPDGELLATMDSDGRIVLRESSGEVVSTLSAPQIDPIMPDETTPWIDNPPMDIAFDESGRIAVGAYASVGMWECGQSESSRVDEPLDATLQFDGPSTLRAGQAGAFYAQIEGNQAPVVTRLLIDGEVYDHSHSAMRWTWHSPEPGTHRVRLEVDDGRRQAIVERVVEVTQVDE